MPKLPRKVLATVAQARRAVKTGLANKKVKVALGVGGGLVATKMAAKGIKNFYNSPEMEKRRAEDEIFYKFADEFATIRQEGYEPSWTKPKKSGVK